MHKKILINTQDIVDRLVNKHQRVDELAQELGVTRQAIWRRLKREGIDISDRYWFVTDCGFCGKQFRKRRKLFVIGSKSYCSINCYAAVRENPKYNQWRQGQRIARAIVSQHIKLEDDWVIDHRDGNNHNNNLDNLRIYASQSDHMKMHHGRSEVEPVWDGRHVKVEDI